MKAIQVALGSFLFVALLASASMAQQRTFVSGLGNDTNPCSRTAPCRTFGQAIMGTNAGGEVYVLDSAGYGPFTITKSITINAPQGVIAGISVFSGDGVDINVTDGDAVILRGLTVNNQQSSGNGIRFLSGGTLHVESCVVNGFFGVAAAGILCDGGGTLEVKDSILRRNNDGIRITTVFGSQVTLDQVRLEDNGNGLQAQSGARVTVRNSVASANFTGFLAFSKTASNAELTIESCVASNNGIGIRAESDSTGIATVRVSNSTVTDNSVLGLHNFGSPAVLLSRGNNTVEGNGTDTMGTIGSYAAK